MFTDPTLGRSQEGSNPRDEDGEKRVLFGAERLIEGISGEAFVRNIVPPISFNEYSFSSRILSVMNHEIQLELYITRSRFRELN